LADSKDVDTVSAELESRLDDIFGVSEVALPGVEQKDTAAHYPLAELKNLILSIDWEITDHVLEQLLQQIKDLKLTYQQDKIVLAFLQILNSLGNYIKNNRAKSFPKTFKTLNAVFSSLDKVVLNRDMTETAKKKILRAEMKRYKELKTLIVQGKTAARKKPKAKIDGAETPVIAGTAVSAETTEDQAVAATEPTAQPPDTETPVISGRRSARRSTPGPGTAR